MEKAPRPIMSRETLWAAYAAIVADVAQAKKTALSRRNIERI